jgi:hypothetical protein
MAGCTGLEPVASDVTVSELGMADDVTVRQVLDIFGNGRTQSGQGLPALAAIFRRRVTPELQSRLGAAGLSERDVLLTVREVATVPRIRPVTVYRLCRERKLVQERVSNAIRIPVEALVTYLEMRSKKTLS